MREPFEEIPSVSDFVRYKLGWFLLLVGLVVAAAGIPALTESLNGDLLGAHGTLRNVSLPNASPAEAQNGGEQVGTSGVTASAAVVREMDTLAGADYHQLIGRKVSLTVPVLDRANDQAFWIGQGDHQMFVEVQRDTRTPEQRYYSLAFEHHVGELHAGEQAMITGTIQPIPDRESMYSWGLTQSDIRQLENRPIYIAADSVHAVAPGQ